MNPFRCDRCGTAVLKTAVLCPVCHALVGVLHGPTLADDAAFALPDAHAVDSDDGDFNGPTEALPLPRAAMTSTALLASTLDERPVPEQGTAVLRPVVARGDRVRQAVIEDAQNAPAWNRLGLLLLVIDTDFDAAAAAFERAVTLAPDDASYRNNLGKAADAAQRRGLIGVLRRLAGRRAP